MNIMGNSYQIYRTVLLNLLVVIIFVFGYLPEVLAADPDERENIQLTIHAGMTIDNFAADEHKTYLNFDESNKTNGRSTFGFDIKYRLLGVGDKPLTKSPNTFFNGRFNPQLWVYGNTLHGIRSTEIDCDAHPDLSVCSNKLPTTSNPDDNMFILRNATSLEGHAGLRFEAFTLQPNSESPANLYVNGQLGFLSISDSGGDVVDMHHAGLGAVIIGGKFKHSFLEAGYGRTDLFSRNKRKRIKVIAKAVWRPIVAINEWKLPGEPAIFAKIVADTDFSSGSDSIQTYLGVSFSLDKVNPWGTPPAPQ